MAKLKPKLEDISYDTYRIWLTEMSHKKKQMLDHRKKAYINLMEYRKYLDKHNKHKTREAELEKELIEQIPERF